MKEVSASVDQGAIHSQEHLGFCLTLEHQVADRNPQRYLSFVPPSA